MKHDLVVIKRDNLEIIIRTKNKNDNRIWIYKSIIQKIFNRNRLNKENENVKTN